MKLYDAIVVASVDSDENNIGNIRANIIGISDDIDSSLCLWCCPDISNQNNTPSVGTYIKVYFQNNDPMMPVYINVGLSLGAFLSKESIKESPNLVVTDLGMYTFYNKSTRVFEEKDIATSYKRNVNKNGIT